MAIIIHLIPEMEAQLEALARRSGRHPSDYARSLVEEHLRAKGAPAPPNGEESSLAQAVARMIRRPPEEIAQAQARAAAIIQPGRPLPHGTTLFDAVSGKWPGDETDEEIAKALEKLS
jgi:predicted DNA-binding protein